MTCKRGDSWKDRESRKQGGKQEEETKADIKRIVPLG